jgi:transposase
MLTVGLDVHWRTSSICILNEYGKKIKELTIRGDWNKVVTALAGLAEPFQVVYEASCGYGHLYELLGKIARRVVVAHPGAVRLIFRCKRKNDRIDAQKLATLLYLDQVPVVHVPNLDVRQWRSLIECRQNRIAGRVACKNSLRAILRSHNIRLSRPWTKNGLAALAEAQLPHAPSLHRNLLLEELASLGRQIQVVTMELDRIARRHSGVALLRTIRGVGPRTAEAMMAYIDTPQRFGRVSQIGAYLGLVPCQDASAGKNRLGHITRQGPVTVRKLLVEATWQVIRRSPTAKARFERIAGGKKERRKIALVAMTHWLSRVMLSMLRTGEAWREAA